MDARDLPPGCVVDALVNDFARDGAVCIRGLFTPSEIAALREGIEHNLSAPSPRSKVASRADDPGFFIQDFCNWTENAQYRDFIFRSPLGAAAAKLTQSRLIRLHHDHMLTKEGGTQSPTPWHQDQPYYNIDGHQNVSFWIPVDPVSVHSTLQFVAGTHRGPWLMPRSFMTQEAKWFPEGSLQELPDFDAHPDQYTILGWALEPGDCVAFNMLTVHSSRGTEPNQRRRAFSVRVIGDDVRHAPRRWVTSPNFPGLDEQLPAGAVLDHPLFPVLYSH
jgi:ectoine hydroxylase-related dioxygenase (phytanoyl-CoA dioxygenase family)